MWDPQWEALQRDFTVIRVDLPGFGRSPVPAGPYTMADEVAAVLPPEPVAVVGSSMGGMVALELAGRHPGRVERLVLLAPAWSLEPTPDAARFDAEETALLEAGDREGAVALNVRTWLGPDATDAVRAFVAEMQRAHFAHEADDQEVELETSLEAIAVPTTIFTGAHDLAMARKVAEHLVATMPDARHTELPWAGHLPSLERPGEMTDLLRASLARSR